MENLLKASRAQSSLVRVQHGDTFNDYPARYEFRGVVWSGRGRLPWVIDCYLSEHNNNRTRAFAAIEADMLKRGYLRVVSLVTDGRGVKP